MTTAPQLPAVRDDSLPDAPAVATQPATPALRPDPRPDPQQALQPHLAESRHLGRWGAAVLLGGVLPLLAWLVLAPLSSAVVAPAFVKVDLDKRPVQHAEGGTVRRVLVRDGQRVARGDVLLVLGDVAVDADLNRLDFRVLSERAGLARLEAEQLGAASLQLPGDLQAAAVADGRLGEQLAKEQALFRVRREALVGQVALLRSQQAKITQELLALAAQIQQAGESLKHQTEELETNRRLQKDGFISATRIAQLEAGIADYRVKLEERRGEHARAEQRKLDGDLRIRALESDYRQQASDQLKVALSRLAELQQEQRKTTDAAGRQAIVAPAAGDVINLRFTAAGAVVAPREPIADIVPADPRLVVEARIRPEDVSRIQQGQPARIRFTAFSHRSTRLVDGKLFYVSPDRLVDRNTGQPYYVAQIEAQAASLALGPEHKLQAGMPAEVYIEGGERTPLQYLFEPLLDLARHAGRER
ncbi:MAG: HlyD family type I secretion periplasmic adaptor subunit [Pseudomonadota bacterium]